MCMGFGSYDESEQQNRERATEIDDAEAVNVHENAHDGEMTFTSEPTEDLIGQLQEIKEREE